MTRIGTHGWRHDQGPFTPCIPKHGNGYNGVLVNADTGIHVRDSAKMVRAFGKYWVLGGWWGPAPDPAWMGNILTNEVWSTPDSGANSMLVWTRELAHDETPLETGPGARWFPREPGGACFFDDHIWIFGEGSEPSNYPFSDVWKSPNGTTWIKVAPDLAIWGPKTYPCVGVFRGRMHILGGELQGGSPPTIEHNPSGNEHWSTTDGINFIAHPRMPFRMAAIPNFAVMCDRMIVIRGDDGDQFHRGAANDVWAWDGYRWVQQCARAPWAGRHWSNIVSYDNRLWVMPGRVSTGVDVGDLWFSEDLGRTWTQFHSPPWPATHADAIWASEDQGIVMGGSGFGLNRKTYRFYAVPPRVDLSVTLASATLSSTAKVLVKANLPVTLAAATLSSTANSALPPTLASLDYVIVDAAGGDSVTGTGTNLNSATLVEVGTGGTWTPATITAQSSTTVTFTTPLKAAGNYSVRVTNPAGTTGTQAIEYFGVNDIAWQGDWQASFPGGDWPGTASAGGSGSRNLTNFGSSVGTALNGRAPADLEGTDDEFTGAAVSTYCGATKIYGEALVFVDTIPANLTGGSSLANACVWNTNGTGQSGVFVRSGGGSPKVGLHVLTGAGSAIAEASLTTGVWQHVQWSWDGTTASIRVNGGTWATDAAHAGSATIGNGLAVGIGSSFANYFDGKIFLLRLTGSGGETLNSTQYDKLLACARARTHQALT